jgi:hypothetical protein
VGDQGANEHSQLTELLQKLDAEVLQEVKPGDSSVWQPKSYQQWERRERTRTVLDAWSKQMDHERQLRGRVTNWVLGLLSAQLVTMFGIVILAGYGVFTLSDPVVHILTVFTPSVFGEIVGLGFVVVKYLFSQPLRSGLDALVKGGASGGN